MTDEPRPPSEAHQEGMTRRQFLLAAGATAATAVVFTGCAPTERRELLAQSRVQLSEDILSAYDNWYASTCRACGAGCGIVVRVIEGRAKKVEGNPDHPINRGRLCARGQALVQEQYHPDRIQGPMRLAGSRGSGSYTPISWTEALNDLAGRLRQMQGRNVAMITRPLRAHRGLVADRFMRGLGGNWFILDTVGEAPLREATRRLTGQDALPVFDIQNARYILSFGADFLGNWISQVRHGVEYGIFRQGSYRAGQFQPKQGAARGYLVHVGPHFSLTAANADEWIPCRPGSEGIIALSIAQVILAEGLGDAAGASVFGGPGALDAYEPSRVAERVGVSAERIRQIARDFASRRPSLALGGGPASSYTNSTEALTAILSLNALTGGIGRQGGLRTNPQPPIAGLPGTPRASRLPDWQRLVDQIRNGQVPAMLVYDADPVHDLPAALGLAAALRGSSTFVVSFSSFMDDTTAFADLILPSHLPLEDWGDDLPDPGPGFPVLSLQQPVVTPLYDTRSFPDVLLVLAEELGGSVQAQLPWRTFKELLQSDLQSLQPQPGGSVRASADRFWVTALQQGGWWNEGQTAPAPPPPGAGVVSVPRDAQFDGSEREYPFHLVAFRHNTLGGGEAAHLPWMQGTPDPITSATWQTWAEINPRIAAEMGLREGDIVAVVSQHGRVEVPVYINPAAAPWTVAMPLGQGHSHFGRWAQGRGANPMTILAPLEDDATGALAYGGTRVRLEKTGRRISLPKFEGNVPPFVTPELKIIQVTRGT